MDEELLRAARTIRADQDQGAVLVGIGELGESGVQDGDVVGGGIATRDRGLNPLRRGRAGPRLDRGDH